MNQVLIVEDETLVALELEMFVSNLGFNIVAICSNANSTLETLKSHKTDIILMDINIKGEINGVNLAQIIKAKYKNIQIIFLSAHIDEENRKLASLSKPLAFLAKPFNQEKLKDTLLLAKDNLAT